MIPCTTLAVEKYTNYTQQKIFLESETERYEYLNDDDLFIYPIISPFLFTLDF